jgi:hypothetical protein
MQKSRELSLFITISLWAIIIGGISYSHVVYFPPYLSHLPESNHLITGEYGLHDENFWMLAHPLTVLVTLVTLTLNWKLKERRKFILITLGIYALAIVATATYFIPQLKAFAGSSATTTVTPSEWFQRGQRWQYMSWVRGFFMYLGFIMLLIALTKDKTKVAVDR